MSAESAEKAESEINEINEINEIIDQISERLGLGLSLGLGAIMEVGYLRVYDDFSEVQVPAAGIGALRQDLKMFLESLPDDEDEDDWEDRGWSWKGEDRWLELWQEIVQVHDRTGQIDTSDFELIRSRSKISW